MVSLLLALVLLLAACGGAESDVSTDDAATDDASDDVADALAGSEDPVDPEPVDEVAVDEGICESVGAVIQLVGEAASAEPLGEQQVDAIELMGQMITNLEDQGADPEVVQAVSDIHGEFAEIINSGGVYDPDLEAVGASTEVLLPIVQSCDITGSDVGAGDSAADESSAGDDVATGDLDPTICELTNDFVTATSDFAQAEIGSVEEQDAVGRMEAAAFDFADGADVGEDLTQAVFDLFESAQSFVETGETGDVQAQGELIDALFSDCVDAGLAEAL